MSGGGIGFIGKHELRIDEKGRVTIPARFKAVLKEQYPADDMQVVVGIDLDKNLIVRPLSEFAKVQQKYEAMDELDADVRLLKNVLVGRATQEKVDAGGRIRLSADLRSVAGLDRDVVCMGDTRGFTIADRAKAEKAEAGALEDLTALAERVRLKNRPA